MGRKKLPIWAVVAADTRSPRDGRFIEDLGRYFPLEEPARVSLNDERVMHWLENGAQPSDTVRNLLSRSGLMLALHLKRKGKSDEEIQQALGEFRQERAEKHGQAVAVTAAERRRQVLEEERKRVQKEEEEQRALRAQAEQKAREQAERTQREAAEQREKAAEAARAEQEAANQSTAAEEGATEEPAAAPPESPDEVPANEPAPATRETGEDSATKEALEEEEESKKEEEEGKKEE